MRNVSFFVFALEALSLTVFAGGFQINAHNAASIGRGLAGESALAESASSIGLNPALGSYLDGSHLSFGLVYLDLAASADGTVNSPFAPTPLPAKDGDLGPDAFIPHAYYLHELNDRVSLGLSLNTHFGLGVDYDDRFAATDFANLGEITTIYLSPSVSVQANPQLSLGFGVSLIQAESELETTVADYQQAAFEQLAGLRPERVLRLKGDDTAFGFNLGLAWRPREDLTLGLSYRAETDLDFRAKVSSDLDDLAPLDPAFAAAAAFDGTGRSEITLPAASEAALAWNVNDDWMLSASAYHVGWSSVESLSVNGRTSGATPSARPTRPHPRSPSAAASRSTKAPPPTSTAPWGSPTVTKSGTPSAPPRNSTRSTASISATASSKPNAARSAKAPPSSTPPSRVRRGSTPTPSPSLSTAPCSPSGSQSALHEGRAVFDPSGSAPFQRGVARRPFQRAPNPQRY